MNKRTRRNHLAVFEAKVVLASLKGDQPVVILAEHFVVDSNQVTRWKSQLRPTENVQQSAWVRLAANVSASV